MTKNNQFAILVPFCLVVLVIAASVMWHLWFSRTGRPAFLLEGLRTIGLAWFMFFAIQRKHYRDVYLSSVFCIMTDLAWLVRLMHFHPNIGY
jgi:hypothetical protein